MQALQAEKETSTPALVFTSSVPHSCAPPATPKWARQGTGLADLDMACDAAVASVQAARDELAGASMPGQPLLDSLYQCVARRSALSGAVRQAVVHIDAKHCFEYQGMRSFQGV